MSIDRIKQLEEFYKEDPNDPFNAYALALEYMNSNPAKTGALFDTLLRNHTDYLPTYYHAARFYEGSGDRKKAIEIFENGIALARKCKDMKTMRELQSAYDELMFE